MEEFITIISNVGFPIAITVYLLVRFEGKMDKLTDTINTLSNAILDSIKK